jgi:hypothetical protein
MLPAPTTEKVRILESLIGLLKSREEIPYAVDINYNRNIR